MSIRAYEMIFDAFGVEYREKENQIQAECPSCSKPWGLVISKAKPAFYRCNKCSSAGNPLSLMYLLQKAVPAAATTAADWKRLSDRRHGLDIEIAKLQGVKRLPGGKWVFPSFINDEKKTAKLAFWNEKQFLKDNKPKNNPIMFPADTQGYWCFGDLSACNAVVIVEGYWDGWAAKQLLETDEAGFDRTFGETFSGVCVMAIPGVNSFNKEWRRWFKGKHVFFSFDEPREDKLGRVVVEEAFTKTAMLLLPYAASIRKLDWPDFKQSLKLYQPKTTKLEEIKDVNDCFGKGWAVDQIAHCWTKSFRDASLEPDPSSINRTSLSEVLVDLRNYISTNPHTERTFVLCMAIVASARFTEQNPLWAFLFAPTGFGKTTLMDVFEKSEFFHKEDAFRASSFVSGYKPAPGEERVSIADRVNGKCLGVMEWTVNMTASAEEQARLNGVLRRLYEGEFKQTYGNGQEVNLRCRFSMLCAVTDQIRVRSTAHLGERFFRIDLCPNPNGFSKDPNDEEEIDHIVRAIENTSRGLDFTVARKVVQLAVASYLVYLAEKYREEPVVPKEYYRRIAYIAQITEMLRFQVERNEHDDVSETQRTGVGTRVGTQFTRLMGAVAMALDKEVPDEECWTYIQRVATDSMSSQPFKVCRLLYGFGRRPWIDTYKLCDYLGVTRPTVTKLMKNLIEIGIVKHEARQNRKGAYTKEAYGLSEKFANFWSKAKMEQFDLFADDPDVLEGATRDPDVIQVIEGQVVAPEVPEEPATVYVPSKEENSDLSKPLIKGKPAEPKRVTLRVAGFTSKKDALVATFDDVVTRSMNGDGNGHVTPKKPAVRLTIGKKS